LVRSFIVSDGQGRPRVGAGRDRVGNHLVQEIEFELGANRIVQEDLPYVSLYHQINVAVMDKDLQGYTMYPAGFWLGIPEMSRTGGQ